MFEDQFAKIAIIGNQDEFADIRASQNIAIGQTRCDFGDRCNNQPSFSKAANHHPMYVFVSKQLQGQAALRFAIDFSSATISCAKPSAARTCASDKCG